MLINNDHNGANSEYRLLTLMGIFHFKRRTARASRKSLTEAKQAPAGWASTFWGRKAVKSLSLMLALLCSASIALADVKITTKTMAGERSLTSTTYIKGARQRTEGMGYTSIYQCDLKRTIQINDKTRSYLITPLDKDGASGTSTQRTGTTRRRGGVVTYTTTNTDTGERREMLGLTARRIKSKTVIEASEGACAAMNMEMETDGWYVDLPGGMSCTAEVSSTPGFTTDGSDCVDEVRYKTEGIAKMGYPVMTTTTMKFNTGEDMSIPASSSRQEVTDISNGTLDAALFDIPAGYKEVKSMQELGSPY
ncbi:MAG TPA: hypothetical protein VF553_16045 [Pyrinomonadaceae bacterium]|jgi:hypothetical protein